MVTVFSRFDERAEPPPGWAPPNPMPPPERATSPVILQPRAKRRLPQPVGTRRPTSPPPPGEVCMTGVSGADATGAVASASSSGSAPVSSATRCGVRPKPVGDAKFWQCYGMICQQALYIMRCHMKRLNRIL